MNEKKSKLPRREFLANLLFAGGVLSVCGLQNSYDMVARRDPEKDGWELPDDLTQSRPNDADDGWELPEDFMDSPPTVIKNPPGRSLQSRRSRVVSDPLSLTVEFDLPRCEAK